MAKLYKYGIRGTANKWMESYLKGRQQFTTYEGSRSVTVSCGKHPWSATVSPLYQQSRYVFKSSADDLKTTGVLSKARKYINSQTLLSLYYTFMYPLLLWGNCVKLYSDPIFKRQKYAVRLISLVNKRESTNMHF